MAPQVFVWQYPDVFNSFSFTMLGASAFKLLKFGFEFTSAELLALVLGMAVAFAVSVLVIKFLMNFIKKHDFKVFGWYRIVLGILVVLIKS